MAYLGTGIVQSAGVVFLYKRREMLVLFLFFCFVCLLFCGVQWGVGVVCGVQSSAVRNKKQIAFLFVCLFVVNVVLFWGGSGGVWVGGGWGGGGGAVKQWRWELYAECSEVLSEKSIQLTAGSFRVISQLLILKSFFACQGIYGLLMMQRSSKNSLRERL